MSSLTTPRGPLPARVYWFRRGLVLGAAFLLVLGLTRVLGGGSDGSDGGDVAAQVGSDSSQTPAPTTTAAPSEGPTLPAGRGGRERRVPEPPAQPIGFCDPSSLTLEPVVFRAQEDSSVLLGLDVTGDEPACWWDVSSDAMTMTVTSGDDDIWSTRECPDAVPQRRAVVREDEPARVVVEWSGRRADAECSDAMEYALPGYYVVEAAALSGEPTDAQFQLKAPPRPEITREPEPTSEPTPEPTREPTREPAATDGPTGAVEPDQVG